VDDEVLTGATTLVGVVFAGVAERLLNPIAVDRNRGTVSVLLNDREQVREQPAFEVGQLARLGFDLLRNRSPSS
jgi:hypothetical protein